MINSIINHRSIRKFKPDEVPAQVLKEVLTAATRASTTGNMQVYSIIATTDPALKEQLWAAHFKQNMVLQAPVHLTFCADFNRFSKWCRQRNADPGFDNFLSFFTASIDALLASQNAALEAEAQGLGICYLGTVTYMAQQIISILQLPELVVPVAALVIGYPDESPGLTDRLPLAAVVHEQVYQDYTAENLDQLYREKENLEQTRELLALNKKETLARIFTENRYTRKDNLAFSQSFLEAIRRQGFMNNEAK
ncbi:MAG: nitroreductase family protein [Bacteroidales bacterium]